MPLQHLGSTHCVSYLEIVSLSAGFIPAQVDEQDHFNCSHPRTCLLPHGSQLHRHHVLAASDQCWALLF